MASRENDSRMASILNTSIQIYKRAWENWDVFNAAWHDFLLWQKQATQKAALKICFLCKMLPILTILYNNNNNNKISALRHRNGKWLSDWIHENVHFYWYKIINSNKKHLNEYFVIQVIGLPHLFYFIFYNLEYISYT